MSQQVDIANAALTFLGEPLITGFDDESHAARLCLTHYGPCRDALLEDAEWSFALEQFQPSAASEGPLYGYSNRYPMPANILRVVDVQPAVGGLSYLFDPNERNRRQEPHQVIGRYIHADRDIYCTGIKRIDQEGIFSPSFIRALTFYLAYSIAIPLTESNSKRDEAKGMWLVELKRAEGLDGMNSSTRRLRTNAIVGKR